MFDDWTQSTIIIVIIIIILIIILYSHFHFIFYRKKILYFIAGWYV